MGNRAIIKPIDSDVGIYLHWNGGRDSVEAFLEYCRLKDYRGLGEDTSYGLARLAQVIGNFFGGTCDIGIVTNVCETEEYARGLGLDNGIYVVKGWDVVGRVGNHGFEQREYDLQEMLMEIDKAQPVKEQIGDFLEAEEVDVFDIKIGDVVFYKNGIDGSYEKHEVAGFGKIGQIVNGTHVYGAPYVAKYGYRDERTAYDKNYNNYILTEKVRKVDKNVTIK